MRNKIEKNLCLTCGRKLKKLSGKCPNCKTKINKQLYQKFYLKDNEKELKKYEAKVNIINCDFNKNLLLLKDTNNELLLEYYKMYSYKLLQEEYDESIFFNNNYTYTESELDLVILHILEHYYLYNLDNIKKIIMSSNYNKKYLSILDTILKKEDEQKLDNKLFNNVKIPKQKKFNATYEEGKAFIWLFLVAYIIELVLSCVVKLTFPLYFVTSSILLAMGLTRLILKRKSFWFGFLIFIIVYLIMEIIFLIIVFTLYAPELLDEILSEIFKNEYNVFYIWRLL